MSGRGVYVAFAAGPGRTADDNPIERNGRFTKHLLRAIGKPGLSIDDVFNEVRAAVSDETGSAQVPFSNSGLIGRFVVREAAVTPAPAPVVAGLAPDATSQRSADLHLEAQLSLWQSIKDSKKVVLFEDYLRRYPEGQFAAVAKDIIEELKLAPVRYTAAANPERTNVPPVAPPTLAAPPPEPLPQPVPTPQPAPTVPAEDTSAQDWEPVRNSADRKRVEAFLKRHPARPFADAAHAQLEQMDWSAANGSNERSKLQGYLNQYNSGRYVPQAREQIE
jgi:hypothetical protein